MWLIKDKKMKFIASSIAIKPEFKAELDAHKRALRIGIQSCYLTDTAREPYRVHFDETGKFYQRGGILHGSYLYVRLLNGDLFAYPMKSNEMGNFHHSYLSEGHNVSSCGFLNFANITSTPKHINRLMTVSNNSGHYRPTTEEMLADLAFFLSISKNLDLVFEDHSHMQQKLSVEISFVIDVLSYYQGLCEDYHRVVLYNQHSNVGKILDLSLKEEKTLVGYLADGHLVDNAYTFFRKNAYLNDDALFDAPGFKA